MYRIAAPPPRGRSEQRRSCPFRAEILAEAGGDVTKVERPRGNPLRALFNHLVDLDMRTAPSRRWLRCLPSTRSAERARGTGSHAALMHTATLTTARQLQRRRSRQARPRRCGSDWGCRCIMTVRTPIAVDRNLSRVKDLSTEETPSFSSRVRQSFPSSRPFETAAERVLGAAATAAANSALQGGRK